MSLIVGIALVDFFDFSINSLLVFLATLLALLILLHFIAVKKTLFVGIFTLLTISFFITVGFLVHKRILPENNPVHYTQQATGETSTVFLEIVERLKPTSYQDKYLANVLEHNGTQSSGLLLLNTNKDSLPSLPLKVGDQVYCRGNIAEVPIPRNPHQFDYGAYLKRKRVYGQLSVKRDQLLMSQNTGGGVRVVAGRFRESIQNKLKAHPFTKDQLAIINALILGQRQGIDRQMSKQYAAAGMMHILAVSGLHVGIILLLLRFVTRPLSGYKLRFVRSGLIILLIWGFAILTGLSPSVLRAATMFSFLEASTLFGSKKESGNALVASAFVLLLFDPLLLYQVGFQLSYLAVLAILWIQPWLSSLLKVKNRILRLLWNTATVTTAAQLGVMPLSLFYFHQFPGLFLLSNILIIPLLGVLLSAGVIVVALASLEILPDTVATSFGSVIDLLNAFIGWVASKEDFVFQHISISIFVMLGLYLLTLFSIKLLKRYSYQNLILAGLSLLLFSSIIVYEKTALGSRELIVFHKNKQTLLGIHTNESLTLQTDDTLWDFNTDSRINAMRDQIKLDTISSNSLKNIISFNTKKVLIIDSLGIYSINGYTPDYIVLTQSPNINLERLIRYYPTVSIIADGNNYKSDIDRWRASCRKSKIPFHSTYEKGAYTIK